MRIHWILWCSCNYNAFTTPTNSSCCSIYYRLDVIYRGVLRSQILGVRVVLAGWDFHQSKAHPRWLPNTCHYKVLLYLPPFGRNSNVRFWPTIRPPIWGVRGTWGVENGTNRNLVPTFIIDFYTYYTCISCTVWPQYTTRQTADRQTDERSE